MMEFECTEYATLSEKIKIIGKELIKEYPNLEKDEVMKISAICDTVPERINEDIKFRRYYFILYVIGENNKNFDKIYSDMKLICNGKLKDELNKQIYNDLEKFKRGELRSFPMISDYYDDNIGSSNKLSEYGNEKYKFDWDKINKEKAERENAKIENTKEAKQQQKENPENPNTQLVEYKEDKWYKKIFSFIKKVFKR